MLNASMKVNSIKGDTKNNSMKHLTINLFNK